MLIVLEMMILKVSGTNSRQQVTNQHPYHFYM